MNTHTHTYIHTKREGESEHRVESVSGAGAVHPGQSVDAGEGRSRSVNHTQCVQSRVHVRRGFRFAAMKSALDELF